MFRTNLGEPRRGGKPLKASQCCRVRLGQAHSLPLKRKISFLADMAHAHAHALGVGLFADTSFPRNGNIPQQTAAANSWPCFRYRENSVPPLSGLSLPHTAHSFFSPTLTHLQPKQIFIIHRTKMFGSHPFRGV